jgi:hypothetical protein
VAGSFSPPPRAALSAPPLVLVDAGELAPPQAAKRNTTTMQLAKQSFTDTF